MNPLDLIKLHDRCGILTAHLTDPLSELTNKIIGTDEPNAVGFYYETKDQGEFKHAVTLFNTYDNTPIQWLRLGYTLDLLLISPFVNRMTFYPLVSSQNKVTKLEEMFRIIVIETIGANAGSIADKNLSYTSLFLKRMGVVNTFQLITGYNLVNKVLLTLMKIRDPNIISSSIVPCPLIKNPISINCQRETANDHEIRFIIEESRREIVKLAAVFVDLYANNSEFRKNVLEMTINDKSIRHLTELFKKEDELISHVIGGIHNGVLSNETLNELIKDLSIQRDIVGNSKRLPLSTNPGKKVEIINDEIAVTYQESSTPINRDPLMNLGIILSHMVESFNTSDPLVFNLGDIVMEYNNAVQGTSLSKITLNKQAHTMSRSAVVTFPSYEAISDESVAIAMYNSNLSSLSKEQLLDVLVYIDSLRDTDGTGDTRFANQQNAITHELALRK
ncbi:MAG: hypothetical protein ABIQ41_01340 [Gemmatimonadales bacterium]